MKKNPFISLQPWMGQILHAIRKDIKNDHLAVDKVFYKTHFGSRPLNRLDIEEIFSVYERELLKGDQEELVEWAINRWVFKHGDVYRHFADRLAKINSNFQEISSLTESESMQVLEGAAASFGALTVYLFSALNSVVFPETIFERMRKEAVSEQEFLKEQESHAAEKESLEQLKTRYERETRRLQEKYEDRLNGVQRKYAIDVEALKKQIRSMQQKLSLAPR